MTTKPKCFGDAEFCDCQTCLAAKRAPDECRCGFCYSCLADSPEFCLSCFIAPKEPICLPR